MDEVDEFFPRRSILNSASESDRIDKPRLRQGGPDIEKLLPDGGIVRIPHVGWIPLHGREIIPVHCGGGDSQGTEHQIGMFASGLIAEPAGNPATVQNDRDKSHGNPEATSLSPAQQFVGEARASRFRKAKPQESRP